MKKQIITYNVIHISFICHL